MLQAGPFRLYRFCSAAPWTMVLVRTARTSTLSSGPLSSGVLTGDVEYPNLVAIETKYGCPDPATDSHRSLGRQIHHIGRAIRWVADHELRETGLSTATYLLVRSIHDNPGTTQNELSEHTQNDKATVTKGVAKLESLGYVSRVVDSHDARIRRLHLTDAGRRIIPSVHAALRRVTEICAADLTSEELEELFELLDHVENAISSYVADAKGDCTRS